ncbi:N-acetyltransferase DgcN [Vitreimonas sp.]|uniref:N-acetyltransferase DgcN n=1 Tax=Vitreimonas sp. TaxID=3069702 RepID=UPI002EDB7FC8
MWKGFDVIPAPYLLYLGSSQDPLSIKTARGVAHWRPEKCVGERRLSADAQSLGLANLSYGEAVARGARTMLIGVANRGGVMTEGDVAEVLAAIAAGLDVASGLHQRLRDNKDIAQAAARHGRKLYDVRDPAPNLPVGNGEKRAGYRLLTVGTDCSVGKMYTSLALERELKGRNVRCDFRATGQTGIMIDGAGVPVDAVVADFISGSVEQLSPARSDGGWDIIEGQGSLYHPSYAGVSLGLLHGAQPDALVICDEPGRAHMRGLPGRVLPSLEDTIRVNLEAARLTNPNVVVVGVAFNTSGLPRAAADRLCAETSDRTGLPVQDPVAHGVSLIVDRMLECFASSRRAASAGR